MNIIHSAPQPPLVLVAETLNYVSIEFDRPDPSRRIPDPSQADPGIFVMDRIRDSECSDPGFVMDRIRDPEGSDPGFVMDRIRDLEDPGSETPQSKLQYRFGCVQR